MGQVVLGSRRTVHWIKLKTKPHFAVLIRMRKRLRDSETLASAATWLAWQPVLPGL